MKDRQWSLTRVVGAVLTAGSFFATVIFMYSAPWVAIPASALFGGTFVMVILDWGAP